MDNWFIENVAPIFGAGISMEKTKVLYKKRSKFQEIEVFENPVYGRVMTLDGAVMVTTKDEFTYHEMIVHVPMAIKPDAKRVLVIGGGDGGTARELTKYNSIDLIKVVEIDEDVVQVSKDYFSELSIGFEDKRLELIIDDGVKFVANSPDESYDLIIIDSTDPNPESISEGLFNIDFYRNCHKILTPNGAIIIQASNPLLVPGEITSVKKKLDSLFPTSSAYSANVLTYPGGYWLFGIASKSGSLTDADLKHWKQLGIKTKYYNDEIHKASFVLPQYVKNLLNNLQ